MSMKSTFSRWTRLCVAATARTTPWKTTVLLWEQEDYTSFGQAAPYRVMAVGRSRLSSLAVVSFFEGLGGNSVARTLRLLAENELSRDDGDVEHFQTGNARSLEAESSPTRTINYFLKITRKLCASKKTFKKTVLKPFCSVFSRIKDNRQRSEPIDDPILILVLFFFKFK